jgi:hypothetical protein
MDGCKNSEHSLGLARTLFLHITCVYRRESRAGCHDHDTWRADGRDSPQKCALTAEGD